MFRRRLRHMLIGGTATYDAIRLSTEDMCLLTLHIGPFFQAVSNPCHTSADIHLMAMPT